MNRIIYSICAVCAACLYLITASCTKTVTPEGSASIIIFNATLNSRPLVTNFNADEPLVSYQYANRLTYSVYTPASEFSFYKGNIHLAMYQYPDTTVHDKPTFDLHLSLPLNTTHTLFLTGDTNNPDTVFTNDVLPYHTFNDSVASIRFVNLSYNNVPVSVNIKGQPNGSVVANLPYKGITGFINFPATANISSYIFEFRNANTGTLLVSYTASRVGTPGLSYFANVWMFRNNNLAFIGSPTGTGVSAQRVIQVPN